MQVNLNKYLNKRSTGNLSKINSFSQFGDPKESLTQHFFSSFDCDLASCYLVFQDLFFLCCLSKREKIRVDLFVSLSFKKKSKIRKEIEWIANTTISLSEVSVPKPKMSVVCVTLWKLLLTDTSVKCKTLPYSHNNKNWFNLLLVKLKNPSKWQNF